MSSIKQILKNDEKGKKLLFLSNLVKPPHNGVPS